MISITNRIEKEGKNMQYKQIVKMEQVNKVYSAGRGIHNFNMDLYPGQIIGLVGQNGVGKTTALKVIAGLIQKYEGRVYIQGHIQEKGEISNKNGGYVIEEPGFFPNLSGKANLEYFFALEGRTFDEYFYHIIKTLEIDKYWDMKVKQYSLGMKQRLAFAYALAKNPDFILLDEPFNGLDFVVAQKLQQLLIYLASQGKAIIISSHILSVLENLITTLYVVNQGTIANVVDYTQVKAQETYLLSVQDVTPVIPMLENFQYDVVSPKSIRIYNMNEEKRMLLQQQLVSQNILIEQFSKDNDDIAKIYQTSIQTQGGTYLG